MPSTSKTPNIGLNKWEGTDLLKRDDFNADNIIIDAKIKEIEESVSGISVPVTKVNSKTGDVVLSAADIKAADNKTIEQKFTDVTSELAEKATPTTLGRVKVGSRLSIDTNGVLSADVQSVDVSGKIDKNILTATGDIIYASAPNSPSRLGKGTSKQVLTMNEAGTLPEWGSASVNIPIVKVYHSANINTASGTTVTLPFDSEEIDTHAMHDTVTNNSRLTCKEAGKYLIIATVNYAPSNTTGYRSVDLYKNGVTRHGFSFKSNGTSDPTINTVSTIWDMSVSDYIEVKVVQNSTTAIDIIGNAQPISRSELLMMKVG